LSATSISDKLANLTGFANEVVAVESVFQHSWLLDGLPINVKQDLHQLGEIVDVHPDQILIQQGIANSYLFLVLNGRLRAELPDSLRQSTGITVARREVGELLGEYSFFDKQPPAVTVVAEVPSRVFRVTHASLRALLARDPETRAVLYENLLGYLVSRLRKQDMELQVFAM
jgi:CRP-like cAMP-binding protein